ncbi:MAG: DUF3368 domain-containing protein [Candidatus Sumerlaeota bacterium]|nr:DUF3368 domain-containing protein [Candidatus Sumerlaeota bacterium]
MADLAVINASPLIFLSRARLLNLLARFYGRVIVPQSVADEIQRNGPNDITSRALTENPGIEIAPSPQIPEQISEWGLGPGESSVLAYALQNPGAEAIIDDLSGRKCATSLSLRVRGTLGIVLIAKTRGYIPAARPIMENLISAGMYLSEPVLERALHAVGE